MCYFSTLIRTALQFSTQTQFQVVGQDCFAGLYRDSANRQKSTLAALSGGCTRKYQHEQALLIISLRFALSLDKIGGTSAMKMKCLSFCIALGLHYLCRQITLATKHENRYTYGDA